MASHDYDLLVIGAGQGGLPAAHMAANLGARVGLVERAEVGGTLVNEVCVPTKALLRSAEVMHLLPATDRVRTRGE